MFGHSQANQHFTVGALFAAAKGTVIIQRFRRFSLTAPSNGTTTFARVAVPSLLVALEAEVIGGEGGGRAPTWPKPAAATPKNSPTS